MFEIPLEELFHDVLEALGDHEALLGALSRVCAHSVSFQTRMIAQKAVEDAGTRQYEVLSLDDELEMLRDPDTLCVQNWCVGDMLELVGLLKDYSSDPWAHTVKSQQELAALEHTICHSFTSADGVSVTFTPEPRCPKEKQPTNAGPDSVLCKRSIKYRPTSPAAQ